MAVIRDMAKDVTRKSTCQDAIYQKFNPDDGLPERLRIIFDIRDEVKDFIDKYVKADNGTNQTEELTKITEDKDADINIRNMAEVILTVRTFFKDNSIDIFFPFLRQNVKMIYVASDSLDDAFHLFTVLNNRGIKAGQDY